MLDKNDQPEAKALTVEQLSDNGYCDPIAVIGATLSEKDRKKAKADAEKRIHAALPTNQSTRIAELEARLAEIESEGVFGAFAKALGWQGGLVGDCFKLAENLRADRDALVAALKKIESLLSDGMSRECWVNAYSTASDAIARIKANEQNH